MASILETLAAKALALDSDKFFHNVINVEHYPQAMEVRCFMTSHRPRERAPSLSLCYGKD